MKKKYKSIFISPHFDDETLFGAYTIMREKPLVIICIDSYIEEERGDNATNEERTAETMTAMKLLGVKVELLHIPDKSFTYDDLYDKLGEILDKYEPEVVYAPAIEENGNPIHNDVGRVADDIFDNVKHYMTYNISDTKTRGSKIIVPTEGGVALKNRMLKCYPSQMEIATIAPFFNNPNVLIYESYQ